MRYVIIGASGHYNQVLEAARCGHAETPEAVAPGCPQEDVSQLSDLTGAQLFNDWRVMLDKLHPEMAVVNPWYAYAEEISRECFERGINVYSEKPLATSFEGLSRLESAWRASGCELGAMLNLNCCGWYRALEATVRAGEIGSVRLIHGQKSYRLGARPGFYSARETYGGTIPWVAIHAVDWALRLGGGCKWVSAAHSSNENGNNGDMESSAALIMIQENGVIGTVDADFYRPEGSARHDDDRLRVTGTRGMIEAINGRVWLENEEKRREIEALEDINPFERFINGIGSEDNAILARQALNATRVCLFARTAADARTAMHVSEETL